MSSPILQDLFAHMEWADALVWTAVQRAPASDTRLHDLLLHMHQTQAAFRHLWSSEERQVPAADAFATLTELRDWARPFYPVAKQLADTVTTERMDTPTTRPWAERLSNRFGRLPADATLADTMLQVALHGVHHRGQLNTRLRELDVDAPTVDYIAWVWLGKPPAQWP